MKRVEIKYEEEPRNQFGWIIRAMVGKDRFASITPSQVVDQRSAEKMAEKIAVFTTSVVEKSMSLVQCATIRESMMLDIMARDGVLILCPECRKPQTLNAFEITHDTPDSRCGEDVDETSIDGKCLVCRACNLDKCKKSPEI